MIFLLLQKIDQSIYPVGGIISLLRVKNKEIIYQNKKNKNCEGAQCDSAQHLQLRQR